MKRNTVIGELVKIVCQFPGGLSGPVIKGEVEQVRFAMQRTCSLQDSRF